MSRFRNVLEELHRRARTEKAVVLMGSRGLFGTTYEQAVVATVRLREWEEAIEILEAADKDDQPEE